MGECLSSCAKKLTDDLSRIGHLSTQQRFRIDLIVMRACAKRRVAAN